MSRYIGNYLRVPSSEPQQISAPGIWSLSEQLAYQRANQWPPARDPYYNQTVLHLSGDVAGTKETNPVTQPRTFLSDASLNNFLLTPNGDVSARPFSPYASSYSIGNCTSSSDWLQMPSHVGLQLGTADFTVECWALFTTVGTSNGSENLIMDTRPTSTQGAYFNFGLSNQRIYWDNGTGTNLQSGIIDLYVWNHIAIVRSSNILNLYINGFKVSSMSDVVNYSCGSTNRIANLSYFSTGNRQLNGNISNLRIVKGIPVYTNNFTPPTSPLQAISGTTLLTCQSNRFIDNSANAIPITVNGTPKITDNSPFVNLDTTSGSGYFDGSGDFLSLPDNAALNPDTSDFTVEAWIYPISTSSLQLIHYKSENDGTGVLLAINNAGAGKVNFYIGNSGSWIVLIDSSTLISTNSWYHIAGTRSGNTYTLWLNGLSVGTATNAGSPSVTANDLRIGRWRSALPYDFNGYISNYRLVKGTAVYTGPFTPPTKSLARSGTDSAASYTSTTNVNTSFPASATSLLTLQTRAPANNQGIVDTSPNSFVVTRTGNVAQGSFSPFSPTGWSNLFNGSNGFTVPSGNANFSFAGEFTWEAFVNFNALPASGGAFGIAVARGTVASNSGFQFLLNNVSGSYVVTATISIGSTDYGPNWNVPAPSLGVWYHVAIVRDSANNMRCYWDGTLRSLSSGPSSVSGTLNTPAGVVSVGYRGNGYNDLYYNGYISNLRMIATAMYSGSNIQIPTAPFSPTVPNTRFLTCQSNRFLETGSNMAITPISSPSVQPFSPFAPTQAYVASQLGGSLRVSASGDIISWPQNTWNNRFSSNNWSIEAWVYPTASTSTDFFVDQWTNGTTTTSLIFTFMGGNFDIYIGSTLYTLTGITPTLNAWTHIVAVRTGGTFSIFQNGVRTHTRSDLGAGVVNNGGTANRASPGFGGGAGCFFHGHRIVIGSNVPYDATNTIISIPTAPVTAISGTASLLLGTGAGIVDASGKHVIETVGNAHKSTAQTKFIGTGADYYDGTSDYLTIRDNPLLELGSGNFTIEAWVYPLNNSSRSIFGHGPDGQNWWAFYLDGTGKLEFAIVSGNSVVVDRISSTTVNTNTWTHVAVTRSGSTFRLFIDGQEPASYTGSPATTSSAAPDFSTDFWIGGQRWSGSGNGFQGYIQDLRVTRGVARYTSNFTPLTRTLELG